MGEAHALWRGEPGQCHLLAPWTTPGSPRKPEAQIHSRAWSTGTSMGTPPSEQVQLIQLQPTEKQKTERWGETTTQKKRKTSIQDLAST